MASNSKILSTLLSIETMAKHLTESHLLRQYKNKEQGPILTKLIDTAFRHLEQCMDILRPCAPISRLPNDILGLIFHAAQDEDWATPSRSTSAERFNSVPLTLSQVSRLWRDISTNLPLLWTTVRITSPWQFQSIETSLSMSKLLPIELKITDCSTPKTDPIFNEEDHETEEEKAKILCDILTPHIPRCRSIFLSIDIDLPYLLQVMLKQFADVDALLLATLSITSQACSSRYNSDEPQLLFDSAPLLSDVRLNFPTLITIHPPLDHLTSLYLKGVTRHLGEDDLFDILSQCPVLGELYLYDELLDKWSETVTHSLSLAALHTLHFYGTAEHTRSEVLCHMVAPSLDHILLSPFSFQDTLNLEELLALYGPVTQQFPSLKTLALMVLAVSHEWFSDVAVYFPDIENLVVVGASGGPMSGSLPGDQSAKLLPNLRSLSLQDITEASENRLCNFIAHRKAAGVALPEILLDSASLANMRHLDWLKTQVEVTECDPWLDQFGRPEVFDEPEYSADFEVSDASDSESE